MTIVCKVQSCPFTQNGFCACPTLAINEVGCCSMLYKFSNGQSIGRAVVDSEMADEYKKNVVILEATRVERKGDNEDER